MNAYPKMRMSPWTAFFIGFFGFAGVTVLAVTAIALRGISMADSRIATTLAFAHETIDGLPDLLERLPESVGDLLNDSRRPDYAGKLNVSATLVSDGDKGRVRPVITIRNDGDEVVSLLAVRVAALDEDNRPRGEWTEVAATPLAIDDEWRGPLMPGATRHVVGSSTWRWAGSREVENLTAAVEVADVRIWHPREAQVTRVAATE